MRIDEALSGGEKDLAVHFTGGAVLNVRYRPSSMTIAQISALTDEARKDAGRIARMVRDLIVSWDLKDSDGEDIPLDPPADPKDLTSDPIAVKVPVRLLTHIIKAVNEDQEAGE